MSTTPIIVINAAECKHCGDVKVSLTRHDYRECTCGKLVVDGGMEYVRRCGDPADRIEHNIWFLGDKFSLTNH